MVERSEAKSVKLSFASKIKIRDILTRNFASHFLLRFAQPFLAKFKWTINWSLSPQGLILLLFYNHFSRSRQSSNPNNSKARSSKSHDISQHFIKNSSKKDKITPEKTNSPKLNSFSPLEDVQLIDSSEDEDETQISMFRNTSDLNTQSLVSQVPNLARRGINSRMECWLTKAQENTKKRKYASFSPKPVSSSR